MLPCVNVHVGKSRHQEAPTPVDPSESWTDRRMCRRYDLLDSAARERDGLAVDEARGIEVHDRDVVKCDTR